MFSPSSQYSGASRIKTDSLPANLTRVGVKVKARYRTMLNSERCALCNSMDGPMRSAVPLAKGVACADCWPHAERFRMRHAPALIEVVRGEIRCSVTERELKDSDFKTMVWTTITDAGSGE